MVNNFISWFLKVITAGLLSLLLLHLFCFLFYNVGIHSNNNTGATDYIWEKSKFYSRATEGFSYGITDSSGFNNAYEVDKNSIDILLMGSSHMEAFNVPQNKSSSYLLDSLFTGKYNVYNIGISGHTLPRCINNLDSAIQYYNPKKYVIIETSTLKCDEKTANEVINNELKPLPSYNKGILFELQKNNYLKLMYSQIKNISANNSKQDNIIEIPVENHIDDLLKLAKGIIQKNGLKLIIVYHPTLTINYDGSVKTNANKKDVESFLSNCKQNNIEFIDMSDKFIEKYNLDFIIPHGFTNSAIATGHLNSSGHKIIAEELYKSICKMEMN